jgi:hypothetical protein
MKSRLPAAIVLDPLQGFVAGELGGVTCHEFAAPHSKTRSAYNFTI